MIITFGFTESDDNIGYRSFLDGYRLGARQVSVTVRIAGDGSELTAEQWAQAAFVASNHPDLAPPGPARTVQTALAEQAGFRLRSLSVGDTVTAHGQMWACERTHWRRID